MEPAASVAPLDLLIITLFLGGTVAYGLWQGRSNRSTRDYFLGGRNLPWWTVMLSIVATETSVLTFISVPGLAYRGNWHFLQLAMGYVIGRVAVSYLLLPLYYKEGYTSIYQYIGERFSPQVQKVTSAIFLLTRILADGVRFFATAFLVQVLLPISLGQAVLLMGGVTLVYTLAGGIKTVVWMDTFQFILYLGSGIISLVYLNGLLDGGLAAGWAALADADKLQIFNFHVEGNFLGAANAYLFPVAVLGGGFLSFASHGVDYMMVQRVLGTRNISAARTALIGSGLFVVLQFALFLLIGGFLWVLFGGIELGVDQEYPRFIVAYLPAGLRGILLAGVLAAAMSTLSSSINSLASSTVNDWLNKPDDLRLSRWVSLGWGLVLMLVAVMFESRETPVAILGLQIASYTYGGLLGLFLLGRFKGDFHPATLIAGLLAAAAVVLWLRNMGIAWTWYIVVATAANMGVAWGLNVLYQWVMARKVEGDG
ncbi:MAG: sodium:solute symporter [Candidatus Marinimicrobia bacterium]|nr:sodium:solute symporter [Candidatus Neomarinimicrobiota bacterium]